ncbi:proline dehydrogenase family protein [bacterium]|nr:proline dehydrogenase family protein [bacterium]
MKWFNRFVVQIMPFFPQSFIWLFSRKYIAGINLDDAVDQVMELNAGHILATMDVLGEDIKSWEEAEQAAKSCMDTILAISKHRLKSGLSVKLTQLGLCIEKEKCLSNVKKIIELADSHGIFVRIDMEDCTTTDDTLDIYRQIRRQFNRVGIVIQAYLKRSIGDVQSLIDEKIADIRICKGIYDESPEVAYKDADQIRDQYMKLAEMCLKHGSFSGLATHDKILVDRCLSLIKQLNADGSRVEFQMLLGVTERLRADILQAGHRMRVYVPYGPQWFGYCMRRMKENPQVAGHVIKNLFIRS